MPLPELNTSGIDISNTVAKINAMRTNDLQRQNLQSEIDARTAQAPAVNAMKPLEMNKAQQDIDRVNLDEMTKHIAYIADQPPEAQETLWSDLQQTAAKKGIPLPTGDIYKIDGVWNPERFKTASQAGIRARNLQLDPSIGKEEWITVINEKFDPTKEESDSNPRLVEKRYISKGYGKIELDPTAPVKPAIGKVGKEVREEKKLAETSKHNTAVEAETTRHNQVMEKIGANVELRAEESARHNKKIEEIMLLNAKTNEKKDRKSVV